MTTYRLPDWLGGHEVGVIISRSADGMALLELDMPDGDDHRIWVMQADLIEVKPPSIDDPVELPLFLEDVESHQMPDRGLLVSTGRVPGSESVIELTAKGTPVTGNTTVSISIDLTAEQSRDLARAAWKLGTEPQSGPIGNRHMGQGPIAAQRPGSGAS